MTRRGAFPGSFNPPTTAHLQIAETARHHHGLDQVDLIVSRVAIGKETVAIPRFEDRVAVLERVAAVRPWLSVVVVDAQLIAELAAGYDVVVMGEDKWEQIQDAAYYGGSEAERDDALGRLPVVHLVERDPDGVSSTGARSGRTEWMAEEAAAFDADTGAWSDPARYARWLASRR